MSKFILVALDESGSWTQPELVEACGGGIFTLYAFDPKEHTHLCEITPSYWLEPVGVEPLEYDGSGDNDRLRDALDEGFYHGVEGCYAHCSQIDSLGDEYKLAEEFDSDDTLDDARDYFSANGCVPPILCGA